MLLVTDWPLLVSMNTHDIHKVQRCVIHGTPTQWHHRFYKAKPEWRQKNTPSMTVWIRQIFLKRTSIIKTIPRLAMILWVTPTYCSNHPHIFSYILFFHSFLYANVNPSFSYYFSLLLPTSFLVYLFLFYAPQSFNLSLF